MTQQEPKFGNSGTAAILRAAVGDGVTESILRAAGGPPGTEAILRAAYGSTGPIHAALGDVPRYAMGPAIEAVHEVQSLAKTKILRPGLYYLVLIDLVGSTAASARLGLATNLKRVEHFVRLTRNALGPSAGSGRFVKDIGDAALLLFSSFDDVLAWDRRLRNGLERHNKRVLGKHASTRRFAAKTIIHIGEVVFGENENPIAFAVNQIFKIEKRFTKGQLGCTDVVRRTLIPRIAAGELRALPVAKVVLPGENARSTLWHLQAVKRKSARAAV